MGLKEELENQFPNILFILDKPHLRHHVCETAEDLGIPGEKKGKWVNFRPEAISNVEAEKVRGELEEDYARNPNDRLRRLIGYLTRFHNAMNYDEFREKGYPVGSGEVHISVPQPRLKIPGVCRHPDPVNPMMALRVFWNERNQRKIVA